MSVIRRELIKDTINKAYRYELGYNDRHEFRQKIILADKSLTEDEKTEAIRQLNETYDKDKLRYNEGTKRICENCQLKCIATYFCEHCVRNYLKSNFSKWTSGNDNIDNSIQKYQSKLLLPNLVVEWVPYNRLKNIKYLTRGGCSEIYSADCIDGSYDKWDPKEHQLKRFGAQKVIFKVLENVENANQSWFEEVCNFIIKRLF